jgi:general secretion pathway protein D
MPTRNNLIAALAVAGALGWVAGVADAGPRRGELPARKPEVVQVVYSVADLVVPIDVPQGDQRAPSATLEGRLMELIRSTVAPSSWQEAGGPGSVQYYPLGMALVVSQTRAVQEEVADLLAALRRLQDVEVCVEMRIVQVNPELAARFRAKAEFTPGQAGGDEKAVPTAFFSDKELYPWFEVFQADRVTNIMQAPKVTMFNGQQSQLAVCDQETFVTEYKAVRHEGLVELVPMARTVELGLRCDLSPTASADRRFVQLKLDFRQTSLGGAVPVFPVQVDVTPEGQEEKVVRTLFVQQPQVQTLTFKQACMIPDGRTMAVSLGSVMVEGRNDCGPEVLSKVPYLGRLFRNVGYSRESREVFLFVTPRIIINEQDEVPTSSVVPRP